MKRPALFASTLCVTALFYSVLTASAQELVTNGGFETGDFTLWTVSDPSNFTLVNNELALRHGGIFYAFLGASPNPGSLLQTLNTTPGGTYQLSFWLASDRSFTVSNSFEVLWNGAPVLSLTDVPAPLFANPYVNFTIANLSATGASSTLEFRYRNDDDFFRLDDVSVLAVPEATTTSLAFVGLGLFGFMAHRKAKSDRSVSSIR